MGRRVRLACRRSASGLLVCFLGGVSVGVCGWDSDAGSDGEDGGFMSPME